MLSSFLPSCIEIRKIIYNLPDNFITSSVFQLSATAHAQFKYYFHEPCTLSIKCDNNFETSIYEIKANFDHNRLDGEYIFTELIDNAICNRKILLKFAMGKPTGLMRDCSSEGCLTLTFFDEKGLIKKIEDSSIEEFEDLIEFDKSVCTDKLWLMDTHIRRHLIYEYLNERYKVSWRRQHALTFRSAYGRSERRATTHCKDDSDNFIISQDKEYKLMTLYPYGFIPK